MQNDRRNFIKLGGLSALGLAMPVKKFSFLNDEIFGSLKIKQFGIQLWTVKEDMAINAKDTLKKIAGDGYKQIESFEGKQGMFWGMTHKEFKKYMDELGMKIISSHCDTTKDFERKAAEAAEIGMKYLICPWKGPQKSIDDFKRFADEFNKNGEVCKKNGIRFAYHNHDYSWKPVDGQIPQEVMMDNTDKNLVDFEMDIYWVVAAGVDPNVYFKKYPNRFRLCHVKDLGKTATGHESVHLGTGTIDFHSILKTGKENGLEYFIVEQEAFTNTNPLESAKIDAAYLKAF
ncbi:inosose dehydratase [mine drainage metagenome]|uniref:Inosose dehydratase n=1 Tax=mine drainage metagenome TaxID=410659 RepID=A0A1J5SAQ6_9ZZZZ